MKNKILLNIASLSIFGASCIINIQPAASAEDAAHTHEISAESEAHSASSKNIIKAEIIMRETLVKDKKTLTDLKLTTIKDNKPLLPSEIKEVHTEKIHLLIFDQTLTDYQHIHPTPTDKPGIYQFEWTPHNANLYKVWVDLTPIDTDKQEYIMATLGELSKNPKETDKILNTTYTFGGKAGKLNFALTFDSPELVSGKPVMGKVIVKDAEGHSFSQLEPVMGAFSHIVAMNEDFKTIAHMHPMGTEPSKTSDRGGPDLDFHFVPSKPGYWKIWVQVKANGNEIFVPFGVNVK